MYTMDWPGPVICMYVCVGTVSYPLGTTDPLVHVYIPGDESSDIYIQTSAPILNLLLSIVIVSYSTYTRTAIDESKPSSFSHVSLNQEKRGGKKMPNVKANIFKTGGF